MNSSPDKMLGSDALPPPTESPAHQGGTRLHRHGANVLPVGQLAAQRNENLSGRADRQPDGGHSRCRQVSVEQVRSSCSTSLDGLVNPRFSSTSAATPLPTRRRVEELWMKVGEEDGGFTLERVCVREVRDFVLHVEAPITGDEEKVGVLIVDANERLRRGIRSRISSATRIEVLGEAGNYQEAIQSAFRLSPDVILMDVCMPDGDGVEAVEAIKRELPKANVILLAANEDVDCLMRAVMAGAVGYIVKGTKRSDLIAAIQAAASGAAVIDRALLAALVQRIPDSERSPVGLLESGRDRLIGGERHQLTRREREVLDLIVDGLSNKEIAERLCVTVDTVKSHVHRIIQKLEVPDRTNAVVKALRGDGRY